MLRSRKGRGGSAHESVTRKFFCWKSLVSYSVLKELSKLSVFFHGTWSLRHFLKEFYSRESPRLSKTLGMEVTRTPEGNVLETSFPDENHPACWTLSEDIWQSRFWVKKALLGPICGPTLSRSFWKLSSALRFASSVFYQSLVDYFLLWFTSYVSMRIKYLRDATRWSMRVCRLSRIQRNPFDPLRFDSVSIRLDPIPSSDAESTILREASVLYSELSRSFWSFIAFGWEILVNHELHATIIMQRRHTVSQLKLKSNQSTTIETFPDSSGAPVRIPLQQNVNNSDLIAFLAF